MTIETRRNRTAALAREVIEEVAPGELPRYEATCSAYFEAGGRLKRSGGDDMLGFGAPEVIEFLTPVVLLAVTRGLEALLEPAKRSLQEGVADLVRTYFKRLMKRFGLAEETRPTAAGREEEVRAVSQEELLRARAIIAKTLEDYRVPAPRRDLLTDAIVGRLAIAGMAPEQQV
jgi:hypothetical protein